MRYMHQSIKRQDVASIANKSMKNGDFSFFTDLICVGTKELQYGQTHRILCPPQDPLFFFSLCLVFSSTGRDGIKSTGRMVSGWWLADALPLLPLLLLLLPTCSAYLFRHLLHPFWPPSCYFKNKHRFPASLSLVFPVFAPWDERKYGEMCRAPCTVVLNFLPLFLICFLIRFSYLCPIFFFFWSRGQSKTFVSTSLLVFSDSVPPPAPPTHSMMYTPCFLFCLAWMYHMWSCLFIYIYIEPGTRSNILPGPEF